MSIYPTPPGAAVADYEKVLVAYRAGDSVVACREALDNVNKVFTPRYFQIKNLVAVGTLVEDEGHSFNQFAFAEDIAHTLVEDIGSNSEAQQSMKAVFEEIQEATRRRQVTDGPAELSDKAFVLIDHTALGLMPELDVSVGLRNQLKEFLANSSGVKDEAALLRVELARVSTLSAPKSLSPSPSPKAESAFQQKSPSPAQ